MAARPKATFIGIVALGLILALGVYELMALRVQSGDVYPPYSSFRTDPLGTRALYESLASLPELEVRRNFDPLARLEVSSDTLLLMLGGERWDLDPLDFDDTNSPRFSKGKFVFAFAPVETKRDLDRSSRPKDADESSTEAESVGEPTTTSLIIEAGLDDREYLYIAFEALEEVEEGRREAAQAVADPALGPEWPQSFPLYTGLFFELPGRSPWQVLYRRDDKPVVIRLQQRRGEVILFADSYLFSNEAMRHDRYPGLISRLVGERSRIIFNETHLGVIRRGGVMRQARRYGLLPPLAVLAVLAALFIWRNALSLVPPISEPERSEKAPGRDAAAGLVNLLRRNIPPSRLIKVCADRWLEDVGRRRPELKKRSGELQQLVRDQMQQPDRENSPVKTSQRIHQIIHHRRMKS